jgi:hypothetical protein
VERSEKPQPEYRLRASPWQQELRLETPLLAHDRACQLPAHELVCPLHELLAFPLLRLLACQLLRLLACQLLRLLACPWAWVLVWVLVWGRRSEHDEQQSLVCRLRRGLRPTEPLLV